MKKGSAIGDRRTDIDFGEAELGVLLGHHQIAGENELATGADGIALDRRDEGEACQPDQPRGLLQRLLPFAELRRTDLAGLDVVAMLVDLGDVVASEKGPTLAGDDGAAHLKIGIERTDMLAKLLPGLDGHGVELFRIVENDPGDGLITLDSHGRGHAVLLPRQGLIAILVRIS
jgi:hypothetical protein